MDIGNEFPQGHVINGKKIAKAPYTPSYADDFLVIHKSLEVLEAIRVYVEQWLTLRGLELHPDKTAIRHTDTRRNTPLHARSTTVPWGPVAAPSTT